MSDAIAEWRATVRANPRHFWAHYDLGVAMAKQGHTAEAIAEFETAYKIEPDPRFRAMAEKLRHSP